MFLYSKIEDIQFTGVYEVIIHVNSKFALSPQSDINLPRMKHDGLFMTRELKFFFISNKRKIQHRFAWPCLRIWFQNITVDNTRIIGIFGSFTSQCNELFCYLNSYTNLGFTSRSSQMGCCNHFRVFHQIFSCVRFWRLFGVSICNTKNLWKQKLHEIKDTENLHINRCTTTMSSFQAA